MNLQKIIIFQLLQALQKLFPVSNLEDIDTTEGRFYKLDDIYWLLVRSYGYQLVESSTYSDLFDMYHSIVVERSALMARKIFLKSNTDKSYESWLDYKVGRTDRLIISDIEKEEIETVFADFEEVEINEVI